MYESDDIPDLSEIGGYWDDRPVKHHHGAFVYPGRRIARIPGFEYDFEPEECQAGMTDTIWILDGRVLLCQGCGLDGT